jgi:hypothetical protein
MCRRWYSKSAALLALPILALPAILADAPAVKNLSSPPHESPRRGSRPRLS